MNRARRISISGLLKAVRAVWSRFAEVVILLLVLTVFLLLAGEDALQGVSDRWVNLLSVFLLAAPLLALAMNLYAERKGLRARRWMLLAGALAVWLGVVVLVFRAYPLHEPDFIALAACVAVMLASFLVVPFDPKPTDVCKWNLCFDFLRCGAVGVAVAAIIVGGIFLLFTFLETLFGMNIRSQLYTDVATVSFGFIGPCVFLALLPGKAQTGDPNPRYQTRILLSTVRYVLLPILLSYLLILYVYAARILLTWTLPNGRVSLPVSVSVAGMVCIVILIYPQQFTGRLNRADRFILHGLPLVLLPLLVLMSVALGRRLYDYGITVSRLYLLVFNVWCYVVCLGLWLIRSRRFAWTVWSFALVFFFCSVGPQSLSNLTLKKMQWDVAESMAQCRSPKLQLPLNAAGIGLWKSEIGAEKFEKMSSRLLYLESFYGDDATARFLKEDASVADFVSVPSENDISIHCRAKLNSSDLPTGYRYFEDVSGEQAECLWSGGNQLFITFAEDRELQRPALTFAVPLSRLRALEKQKQPPLLRLRCGRAELVCWLFYCSYRTGDKQCALSLDGLLFHN